MKDKKKICLPVFTGDYIPPSVGRAWIARIITPLLGFLFCPSSAKSVEVETKEEEIMPRFGKESLKHRATLHPDLQRLADETIKHVDFAITRGFATPEEQFELYKKGRKLINGKWVVVGQKVTDKDGKTNLSMHNHFPALAMDVAPTPPQNPGINWNDEESFTLLAGIIKGIALMMGIKVRIGNDWDGDLNTVEHKFIDRPHIELVP